MATSTKHVKNLGNWKPVKIDPSFYEKDDFNDFVSLEKLTDYEIVTGKNGRVQIKYGSSENKSTNKSDKIVKKQKNKTKTDDGSEGNVENLDQDSTKKKKKNKKKIKQKTLDVKPPVEQKTEKTQKIKSTSDKTQKKKRKRKLKEDNDDVEVEHSERSTVIEQSNVVEVVDMQEELSKSDKLKSKKNAKKLKQQRTDLDAGDTDGNNSKKSRKRKAAEPKKKQGVAKKWKLENSILNEGEEKTNNSQTEKPYVDMNAWKDLFVPAPVLKALQEQGFSSPTSIQALALPSAIRDRMDIVGAAETGSGKTLAFGIPVLHQIIRQREQDSMDAEDQLVPSGDRSPVVEGDVNETEQIESDDAVSDVSEIELDESGDESEEILDDSNEDRVGCVNVIKNVKFDWLDDNGQEEPKPKKKYRGKLIALILTPTRELAVQVRNHLQNAAKFMDVKIAVIVGGMAPQKQQRMLRMGPEIVVATPGRLWELIQQGEPHLSNIEDIRCLVIDEADRMVEKGHFQELTSLLELINTDEGKKKKRQTFVFSATLTFVHQGPQRIMKKKKKFVKHDTKQKLDSLMEQIGIKDKPKVIDLTRKMGTAETLSEARINCTREEKDIYLYYFLLRHPGRTLVFANSIDCIRRLTSVFTILGRDPLALHASMHQKQRLKNLERFTANDSGLLLATDVAARGLDIPNVQHVIHYQVPRTCENYIHRSGRTARAMKEGVSVVLIGQEDLRNYRKIILTLNKDEDLPVFPVDEELVPTVKARVTLARKVDVEEHRFNKKKHENDWFLKAAREMDVDIEGDRHLLHDMGDSHEQSVHRQKIKLLRSQLSSMLKQGLASRAFSGQYPTKSGQLVVPSLRGSHTDAITTLKSDKGAQDSLKSKLGSKSKVKQMKRRKKSKK